LRLFAPGIVAILERLPNADEAATDIIATPRIEVVP